MLALPAIDTTEITDLVTTRGARAVDILDRDRVNFHVEKLPVYLPTGAVVPGKFATVRTDTMMPLGIVGSRYQVMQASVGLNLLDGLASCGHVEYGKAGTFDGGVTVFIQVKLPGSLRVGPDEVAQYLLFVTRHDGSGVTEIFVTPIRVVCRNTLAAAIAGGKNVGMKIRHTASAAQKIATAEMVIANARNYFGTFKQMGDALFSRRMLSGQIRTYVENVFPATGEDGKASSRLQGIRDRVIVLAETGRGNYEIRGTAWAAYNAVTEYVDHHRSTRGEETNRLQSALLGSGAEIKRRAFDLAIAV
jgi:phage/plasmid-like protein (TIGR03299 family)